MRASRRTLAVVAALAIAGMLAAPLPAQQPGQAPPPRPYKAVAVTPPQPVQDPSFETFRKTLTDVAQRKDRSALARLVADRIFWIPAEQDIADPSRPGIDTLAKAIGLDGPESAGWEILANYASDPTADPDPDRKDMLCGPGDPDFDEKAADVVAQATGTDLEDWAYPVNADVEVRADPAPGSRVIGKLGMHLVWVYPEQSPASAVHVESVRIVMPSGALGFVPIDALLALEGDQLCYVKSDGVWKIAGLRGGNPDGAN
jgi:hypothetical protein